VVAVSLVSKLFKIKINKFIKNNIFNSAINK